MDLKRYQEWRDDNDQFGQSAEEQSYWAQQRKLAGTEFAKRVGAKEASAVVDAPRQPGWERDMTNGEVEKALNNKRIHGRTPSGNSYLVLNSVDGGRVVFRLRSDGRWDSLGYMP